MEQHPDLSVEHAPDVCRRNGSAARAWAWGPGLPWLGSGAFPHREPPLAALGVPTLSPLLRGHPEEGAYCLVLETMLQICWTLQSSRLLPADKRGSKGSRVACQDPGPPVSRRSHSSGSSKPETPLQTSAPGVCAHQLFSNERSTYKRRMTRKH